MVRRADTQFQKILIMIGFDVSTRQASSGSKDQEEPLAFITKGNQLFCEMGRDIPSFPLDEKFLDAAGLGNLGHYPPNIQNLVVSLQNLHPQELRMFFHALFQSMSPASKQVGFRMMPPL